jgi:uncharacterized membrane protein
LACEVGGLLVASPLYACFSGNTAQSSVLLLVAVSVAVMSWSPLHNTFFDWLKWQLARRVASRRPQRLRMLHAVSHETTSTLVTLPIIMLIGDHGFVEALAIDISLTLFYTGYTYVFHLAYDWLRPLAEEDDVAAA